MYVVIKGDHIPWVKLILGLYILKILNRESAYGNQIAEQIKHRSNKVITPNTNALYPLLRRMEELGYVIGDWDNPDKRSKRIYHITDNGKDYIPVLEKKARERFILMEQNIQTMRKSLLESGWDIKYE